MNGVWTAEERRRSSRHRVKEGAFALIHTPERKLGQIQDISDLGIAITYIDDGKMAQGDTFLDLFARDRGCLLENAKIAVLSDVSVESPMAFSTLPMRMLRARFRELRPQQKRRLIAFIRQYAKMPQTCVDPPQRLSHKCRRCSASGMQTIT